MDLKKGVYYSLLISTPHLREELRLVRQSQQIHAPNDRVISRRRFVDGGGKQGRRRKNLCAERKSEIWIGSACRISSQDISTTLEFSCTCTFVHGCYGYSEKQAYQYNHIEWKRGRRTTKELLFETVFFFWRSIGCLSAKTPACVWVEGAGAHTRKWCVPGAFATGYAVRAMRFTTVSSSH